MRARTFIVWVLFAGTACANASCESPVEDALIAAQGDEVPGVEESGFHRYGQNCLACHGGYGPGPKFAFGGTVFATPDEDIPVKGATVTITDAAGNVFAPETYCAGTFYIEEAEPQYPVRVDVECPLPDGTVRLATMGTRINREGGCAYCHAKGAADSVSAGQIYCVPTQPTTPFEIPDCCGGPTPNGKSCEDD